MKYTYYYLTVLSLLMTACDVFDYHPYDIKLKKDYIALNSKYIQKIQQKDTGQDTVRFAFMGDTQRFYDETEDFIAVINKRQDIDFVIHGGDVSDFGMKKEFVWLHDRMKNLNVPYVTLCGNHDILGSGKNIYRSMYGEFNFSFIFGKTKFICLNTNALEFDYSIPVPDFKFIEKEIQDTVSNYNRTVVVMHVPPGDVEFNNNVSTPFQEYLKKSKKLMFCLHAHTHALSIRDYFNDGILYYGCENIGKRSYLLFTIMGDYYTYEVVRF